MLSTPPRRRATMPGTNAEVSWATANILVRRLCRVRVHSRAIEQHRIAQSRVVYQDVHRAGPLGYFREQPLGLMLGR
jgi:hypothetical protein